MGLAGGGEGRPSSQDAVSVECEGAGWGSPTGSPLLGLWQEWARKASCGEKQPWKDTMDSRGQKVPGKWKSVCKGPETRESLVDGAPEGVNGGTAHALLPRRDGLVVCLLLSLGRRGA